MTAGEIAVAAALPWLALAATILLRIRRPPSLESYAALTPMDAELVSVIVPARNEARNIGACVHSILASTWPRLEVIVVNDHSSDGTGEIAARIAAEDSRVTVIDNPDLPEGWIGKQWACHNGARAAHGATLLFTDADTRHGPELLARSMRGMQDRGADLFTVAGSQTMETFWERLIQPHVFGMLVARFGDMERLNRSTNPTAKIANGQFILARRADYDRAGGHEAVRTHVAEDLRLAQEWTRLGYSVQIVVGFDFMSTRMYEGFYEIWRGWGKNLWAAGKDTIPGGRMLRALVRIIAPLIALWEIAPPLAMALALLGYLPASVGVWGAITFTINTLYWAVMHAAFRAPISYALLNPLAATVMMGMVARSAWKGDRVEWKGRAYVSR